MVKKNNKKQSLLNSFYHAIVGIKTGLTKERNMLIHFAFIIAVVICGILFKITYYEWLICAILFALVISLELVNTAIETTVDICMPDINEKAKIAKDTAAGAVLFSSLIAAIIGLVIFVPKGINWLQSIL